LEGKQDKIAADEFVTRFGDRLITCKGRVFWNSGNGIFTDNIKTIKSGMLDVIQNQMKIYISGKGGTLIPYSRTHGMHRTASRPSSRNSALNSRISWTTS